MSEKMQDRIAETCDSIRDMLIEKNKSYGNSFADPIYIFAEGLTPHEQLGVRIDDKLNRLKKGREFLNEDTISDLIGYLILWKVLDDS